MNRNHDPRALIARNPMTRAQAIIVILTIGLNALGRVPHGLLSAPMLVGSPWHCPAKR